MTMTYDRAVLLAKIESVFGTDAEPTTALDALLVGDPNFTPTIAQLERNNSRSDLSPLPFSVGRKTAQISFTHEVRHNGNTDGTTPGKLGRLLRACGMSETQFTGASGTIGTAVAASGNTGTVTWAKTTAYTQAIRRTLTITCTTPGGTGVAEVSITAPAESDLPAINMTGVVLTDSSVINVVDTASSPAAICSITPTVGTSLDTDDEWTILLTPAGYQYLPVSDSFSSVTLYLYYQGLLHIMTGARGTFTMEAIGGQYGLFSFTFTGDYVAPTDVSIPTDAVYETAVKPQQTELANLTMDGVATLCAARFAIDMANEVNIRECINQSDAYAGAIITGRQPTLSYDPETVIEATHAFWAKMAAGAEMEWKARIGNVKGNACEFYAPAAQYSNLAYTNRNNIRAYDATLGLARSSGNDELLIHFS